MLQGNKKGCALPSNRTRPRTVQRPLRKSFEGGVLPVRVSCCALLANFRRLELFWDTESSTSHTTPLCVRGVVVGWLVLCLVHNTVRTPALGATRQSVALIPSVNVQPAAAST